MDIKQKLMLNKRFWGLTIYQIAILVILFITVFMFSDNSIIKRAKYDAQIRELKHQIKEYRTQAETDKQKLEELRSNDMNLEKFARENFLMKKENEDVFIIEE